MNTQTRLQTFFEDVDAHKAINPVFKETAISILQSIALDALLAIQDIEQEEIKHE
jgi:hypothetical protein